MDAEGRRVAIHAASNGQQRMWFLQQCQPDSPAYSSPAAFHLRGPLQYDLLEAAIHRVIERHDSLRTSFANEEDGLVQRVASSSAFRIEHAPVPQGSREERHAAATRLIGEAASRPFDLAAPPLRAVLARIEPDEHLLLIVMHHIITDGSSSAIFGRELSAIYTEKVTGVAALLPQLPVQFADFSAWQRRWLGSAAAREHEAYWKGKLAGEIEPLDLPLDHIRPASISFRGSECSLVIDAELVLALKTMVQASGATLFMALLAAFKTLLHRYTGQADLTVGAPIANRQRVEVESLIGFFANTLALRTDLSGDPTFEAVLDRVKETALGAYEHQDVPFELLAGYGSHRDTQHTPWLQALFALRDFPEMSLDLPGIEAVRQPVSTHTAKFDLTLAVRPEAQGMTAALEFNTDIFEPARARRMLEHWRTLLLDVAVNPARRISEIPLLAPAEKQQVLVEWNQTVRDYPAEKCLHELLEGAVKRTPGAIAVRCGDQELTYRELDQRSNQLAHHLRDRGVVPGMRVGLCVERSPELVVAVLGILKAGGAYMPLDPNFPPARLAMILEESESALLITQRSLLAACPAFTGTRLCLDEWTPSEPETAPAIRISCSDAAYVIYTSGSTGRPKGVVIEHRSAVNLLDWSRVEPGIDANDVLLAVATISFDMSVFELLLPLTVGACLVIVPEAVRTDGSALGALIEESGATIFHASPAMWELLLQAGWRGRKKLKALVGGEALPPDLADRILDRCADLWNLYGPTETTMWSLGTRIRKGEPITIGKPIANTAVYLVDRRGHPAPIGVPGELWIGGVGVARGYLNQPALTAERFIADPFSSTPGARLYRTGDLCRWRADGVVEFLGRIDLQVKLRGFRIELGEIEAVLREMPGVSDAIAVLHEAPNGNKSLAGYVVPRIGATPEAGSIRSFLEGRLPAFMIPSLFAILEALPLTPNGKVDRKGLSALEPDFAKPATRHVEPATPSETIVAAVWQELLGRDSIGVDDVFFDLGGHSLLAARMLARLESVFGEKVPLAALFAHPTVRGLARYIDAGQGIKGGRLIPIRKEGTKPPFFLFYGDVIPGPGFCFELGKYLGADQPLYVVPPPELRGYPTYPTLEETAKALVASIRNVRPAGPYVLGGYCYAGFVAYEAARQIEALGEPVELLILVDTLFPNRHFLRGARRFLQIAGGLAGADQHRQRRAFAILWTVVRWHRFWSKLPGRDKLKFFRLKLAERLARRPQRQTPVAPAVNPGEKSEPAAVSQPLEKTLIAFQWELADYSARPYSGRVALFPSDEAPARASDSKYGWRDLVQKIDISRVPGNHGGCVTSYRAVLFEKLKACLEARRA